MIDEKALSLNYIKKLPLPGSDAGLRYMLRTEERIPRDEENEDTSKASDKDKALVSSISAPAGNAGGAGTDGEAEKKEVKPVKVLCAYAWPEPLCYARTDPSLIVSCDFPLTQEGKLQAVAWLEEQRESVTGRTLLSDP